jgi:hypothetical protein
MKAQEIYMRHQTIYIKSKPETEELFVEDIDYDVIQLIMVFAWPTSSLFVSGQWNGVEAISKLMMDMK